MILTKNTIRTSRRGRAVRGVTLTELLVVISIIVLVTAMLVPMLAPVLRGQKIREATRQINSFFSGAQARATEAGRPVGVWIERAEHGNGLTPRQFTSYKLYQAETPPAYSGDIYDARVNLAPANLGGTPIDWTAVYQPNCCSMLRPTVPVGEENKYRVRFGGRGPTYQLTSITNDRFTFRVDDPSLIVPVDSMTFEVPSLKFRISMGTVQYSAYTNGVSFEILGPPIKAATAPLELPRNTGIDLSLSGYQWINNPTLTRFRDPDVQNYDILVMFDPRGGVAKVQYLPHEGAAVIPPVEQPLGMISLLIVRDDKIGRDRQGNNNYQANNYVSGPLGEGVLGDPDSTWMWIDTRTGRIQSAPNLSPFDPNNMNALSSNTDIRGNYLMQSQTLIRSAIDQGGR